MVKKIITKGRKHPDMEVLVDDNDFDWLNEYRWHPKIEKLLSGKIRFYVITNINGKNVLIHRLIMNPPKNMVIDHINGDTLDNRRSNLRIVTQRQNHQKRKWKKKSKYPGVSWNGCVKTKPWTSHIFINKKSHYLGYFKTEKEAFEAYKKAVHDLGEVLVCELDSFNHEQPEDAVKSSPPTAKTEGSK